MSPACRETVPSVEYGPEYTTQYPPRSGRRFDAFRTDRAPTFARAARSTRTAASRPLPVGYDARMTIQPCVATLWPPGRPITICCGSGVGAGTAAGATGADTGAGAAGGAGAVNGSGPPAADACASAFGSDL